MQSVPTYLNSESAAYLNTTSKVCNVPPPNATFIANFSNSATGQVITCHLVCCQGFVDGSNQ